MKKQLGKTELALRAEDKERGLERAPQATQMAPGYAPGWSVLGDLLRETLALVGYAGVLFILDARLAIVCLTGAPLIVYPLVRLGQRIRRTTRRSQEALSRISHLSAESFTGHRIVKAFGTEAQEAARFTAASQQLYRINLKVTAALASLPVVWAVLVLLYRNRWHLPA